MYGGDGTPVFLFFVAVLSAERNASRSSDGAIRIQLVMSKMK